MECPEEIIVRQLACLGPVHRVGISAPPSDRRHCPRPCTPRPFRRSRACHEPSPRALLLSAYLRFGKRRQGYLYTFFMRWVMQLVASSPEQLWPSYGSLSLWSEYRSSCSAFAVFSGMGREPHTRRKPA